jgi:hypothetical protein
MLSNKWEAKHVIIELFEVFDINDAIMVPKLQQLIDKFSLTHKILVYLKDQGFNL